MIHVDLHVISIEVIPEIAIDEITQGLREKKSLGDSPNKDQYLSF
jgi:hypothetical protein